jgi:hypothetical protein
MALPMQLEALGESMVGVLAAFEPPENPTVPKLDVDITYTTDFDTSDAEPEKKP